MADEQTNIMRKRVCILTQSYEGPRRGKFGYVRCVRMREGSNKMETPEVLVCDTMAETFEWAYWVDQCDVAVCD